MGFPVDDDVRLFEKLGLEGFQAGLSWLTILRRRENFRRRSPGSTTTRSRLGERDVTRLLCDTWMIRRRGKIEAVINNAGRAVEFVESEGRWRRTCGFEPARRGRGTVHREICRLGRGLAHDGQDLKRRGWRFVGHHRVRVMRGMGPVNNHMTGCAARVQATRARKEFHVPGS